MLRFIFYSLIFYVIFKVITNILKLFIPSPKKQPKESFHQKYEKDIVDAEFEVIGTDSINEKDKK